MTGDASQQAEIILGIEPFQRGGFDQRVCRGGPIGMNAGRRHDMGADACAIPSQLRHDSFGRTCRMTRNEPGT